MDKREILRNEIKNATYGYGGYDSMVRDEDNYTISLKPDNYDFEGCPQNYVCFSDATELCEIDEKLSYEESQKKCRQCWKQALGE